MTNRAVSGAACRVQHVDRNDKSRFAYKSPLQPFLGIWGMFWTTFFILVNGFSVLQMGHFKFSHFLYVVPCWFSRFGPDRLGFPDINIPIYIALYFGYKVFYRTKIPKLKDVDLVTNIPSMEETEARDTSDNNLGEDWCRVVLRHYSCFAPTVGHYSRYCEMYFYSIDVWAERKPNPSVYFNMRALKHVLRKTRYFSCAGRYSLSYFAASSGGDSR